MGIVRFNRTDSDTFLNFVEVRTKCWKYFVLLKFVLYRILGFWLAKIHTVQSNWNALNVSLLWLVCCNSPLLHVRIHIINQSLSWQESFTHCKKVKIFTFPWTVIQQSVYQRGGSLSQIKYIFCSRPGLFNYLRSGDFFPFFNRILGRREDLRRCQYTHPIQGFCSAIYTHIIISLKQINWVVKMVL